MYTQTYENRNIDQAEIDRNGKLITSFDFVDCKSAEKIEINRRDATIFRGEFEEIEFSQEVWLMDTNEIKGNEKDEWRVQLIRLCGTHIKKLKTPRFSKVTANWFHDDAEDGKAFVHSDLLLDEFEVSGVANVHNAEIEKLTVQASGEITLDETHGSKLDMCRVFGTLHLNGLIPFKHIELYPGGRIRVWNIEKDDDIPRFVGMRGKVLIQKARGGGFWYFG